MRCFPQHLLILFTCSDSSQSLSGDLICLTQSVTQSVTVTSCCRLPKAQCYWLINNLSTNFYLTRSQPLSKALSIFCLAVSISLISWVLVIDNQQSTAKYRFIKKRSTHKFWTGWIKIVDNILYICDCSQDLLLMFTHSQLHRLSRMWDTFGRKVWRSRVLSGTF